jgi:hypothetical protein
MWKTLLNTLFCGLLYKLYVHTLQSYHYAPCNTMGSTSMTDMDASTTADTFITARYAELVENPICIQNRTTRLYR